MALQLFRKDADLQLSKRISDAGLRAWLLMNLWQDEGTGKFGWRANIAGILQGFKDHIGESMAAVHPSFIKNSIFVYRGLGKC